MDSTEFAIQLTAIRDNLPIPFSQQSARKLMSSYENYKRVVQSMGNKNAHLFSGVGSELNDIESDIKQAIKGTPKKEAESRFLEARRHLTDDINSILGRLGSSPSSAR